MPERQDKLGKYALVLLIVGALARLILMILPHPFSGMPPIDETYTQAAQDILRFNFHALGDRVPVYPLLVALCGLNPRAIWAVQSIMGVASSLMIFDMAFRRTRHGLFSLFVGLTCSLIPEALIYEASVLTEALTNFLLMTSLWFISRCDDAGESNVRYPLGLGAIVALAGLTRPLMICLAPLYYFFLVPSRPLKKILRRETIKRTFFYALPVVAGILGWCGFNYFNNGNFTVTTLAGDNLIHQVDPYVDLAPDRFAVLRDIWLQSRPQGTDNFSHMPVDTYVRAVPEMERQTGKTETQVRHELASLALYLQIHHPLLCLRRAEQGWMKFWGEPDPKEIEWPQSGRIGLREFVTTTAYFFTREVKGAFLVLALISIPCALFRLKAFTRFEYLIFAIALWASIFAAFTEFGDNRRFCVPFYMVMIYTLLTRGWVWIAATSANGPGPAPD
jgi:hypothetical protein